MVRSLDMSIQDLITFIIEGLYVADKNMFSTWLINGIVINLYFYFICTFIIICFLLLNLYYSIRNKTKPISLVQFNQILGITLFCIFMAFQMAGQGRTWLQVFNNIKHFNIEEVIQFNVPKTYGYALHVKNQLHGKHTCKPITNKEIYNKHFRTFINLAYYLYPINIRIDVQEPIDCLTIFVKDNPLESVPDGFKPLKSYDDLSLLAIRN